MWFWPTCASLAALAVTLLLLPVRPGQDQAWARWIWPSGMEAASTLLQAVATSVMTAVTVTFSLTVVALQLASQQFSPRLLREFARDKRTQLVLAVLLSTFVVSITGLRGMDPQTPVPVLVVGLVYVLGIACGMVLLLFIGHITRSLRVDTMMVTAHGQALAVLRVTYPESPVGEEQCFPAPEGGTLLRAPRSGIIKALDWHPLVEALERSGQVLHVDVQPGDHVALGAPIGRLWNDDGAPAADTADVTAALARALEIGYERTPEQDAALGLRQLTDIAVKAISPSINDPVTCSHALGYCADLLVDIQHRRLGPEAHQGRNGTLRLVTAGRDYRSFIDLVCAPVRHYGSGDPIVLTALLRLLRDCAASAANDTQRDEIRRQTSLVLDAMDDRMVGVDAEKVRDMVRRVELALEGELLESYLDRAGETRSA
ncbi:hypothetical protein BN1051_02842 [Arthrobacter saudimassiliensis]|uniref:DUF2254 domain-containing protein n=2 Tax=Actinomycetes TaxID=1760 RepID=A0A078MVL1_9MICC|nr:hypothetical protein BN1051_02842 [Arthrobacter saudimassiliensis]